MRHSYNGARSGRMSSRGPCSRCGRVHPRGKKQKQKALLAGFSCRSSSIKKMVVAEEQRNEPKNRAKNAMIKERNAIAKQERRQEAKLRQKENNRLTIEEKIARLDARLGKGIGAAKERARLEAIRLNDALLADLHAEQKSKPKPKQEKNNARKNKDHKRRKPTVSRNV